MASLSLLSEKKSQTASCLADLSTPSQSNPAPLHSRDVLFTPDRHLGSARILSASQGSNQGAAPSRFRRPVLARIGRQTSWRTWRGSTPIDIFHSIVQAWQRGRPQPTVHDLVSPVRLSALARLIIFMLDVSDSMHQALEWMQVWLQESMGQAYLRRDPVAVVVVQGQEARVLIHPTTSLGYVAHRLSQVRVGGGTPLDQGLAVLRRLMLQHRDEYPAMDLCLLTDARSTGNLQTREVHRNAAVIRRLARDILLINPKVEEDRFTLTLARLLGARLVSEFTQ